MNEIVQRYRLDEYFLEFINRFVETDIEFIERYQEICDVRPRNIYKLETDIKARYINESIVIYLAVSFLVSNGFERDNIVIQIQELGEFFPWIADVEMYMFPENQENFGSTIEEWLKSFFSIIEQRTYGEFYSPTTIISAGLRHMDINKNKKVIDPSCGCGFFLSAYIDELIIREELNNQEDLEILQSNIYGYDIFPFVIVVAKMILGEKCSRVFNCTRNIFRFNKLVVCNTMNTLVCNRTLFDDTEITQFDLIVGNPPYFRIDPHEKNNICTCVSYGHNYIHNLFLHWSIQHIANEGEICLVLPQSILSGLYYKKVRAEMLEKCYIEKIIANVEGFFGVQQEIMILILKAQQQEVANYIIETLNNEGNTENEIQIPLRLVNNVNQLIPTFKYEYQLETLNRLARNPIVARLNEIQLSTGNFVWNQNKDICLKEYQQGAVRAINGPNITSEGFNNNSNDTTFPYCIPNNIKYIKNDTAILYRRMSPIGNEQRMVAAIIDSEEDYIVENHVNIISCEDINLLPELLEFITSVDFNVIINSFCQTNQVSINELKTIFTVLQNLR